ncbi:hypothetical protein ACSHDR_000805 [Cronobacter sakazakii]|nr:hypothetical protein [Cronobacter sakazakii]
MSEISEVIASEIADFFAGFGGPGEPDIQSGKAQRLLTKRLLSVLALRERAEPVAYRYRFRPTREAAGKWILVDTLEEANPLPKYEIQPLYTAPPAPVVAEWTNDQCFEFLAVAFRHAEIKGDFELDDLRLGVKMANAMTQVKEGGCLNPQQSANLC